MGLGPGAGADVTLPHAPSAPTAFASIVGDVQDVGGARVISYRWDGASDLALVDAAVAHFWKMPGAERRAVGYQFKIGAVTFYVRAYDAQRGAFVVERVSVPQ